MKPKFKVVIIRNGHLCGKCRELIPGGSKALRVEVPTFTLTRYGRERPVTVKVYYDLGCRPSTLG